MRSAATDGLRRLRRADASSSERDAAPATACAAPPACTRTLDGASGCKPQALASSSTAGRVAGAVDSFSAARSTAHPRSSPLSPAGSVDDGPCAPAALGGGGGTLSGRGDSALAMRSRCSCSAQAEIS